MVKDFLKSSANVLMADMATKGIGFGILVLLTFLLQPAELGKYNALLTTITSLYGMSGLGVAMVLQRESARHKVSEEGKINEFVPAGLIAMAFSLLIILVLFGVFHQQLQAWVFTGMDVGLMRWVPPLTCLYFLVQSPITLMLGLGQYKLYAFRNLVEVAISGAGVLIGGYFWHLEGMLYGLCVSYLVNALIVWIILKRLFIKHQIQMIFRRLRRNAGEILKHGVPYFFGNTFIGAIGNIILVGLFSSHIGYEELGFLRIGLSLSAILMVIPNAAKTVTISFIARHGTDSARLRSIQIRYLFSSIILSTILLISAMSPLIRLMFGDAYSAGIEVYSMILLVQAFFSMQQILNSFMAGSGKLLFSGMVNTVVAILYIVLALVLIPGMGISGYYIAFGVSYLLGLVVFITWEMIGQEYDDKRAIVEFLGYSFVTMGMAFLIVMFGRHWWDNIVLSAIGLTYGVICILKTFNHDEKQWFKQLLSRKQIISQ